MVTCCDVCYSVHVGHCVCFRTWGHDPLQGVCVFSWFPLSALFLPHAALSPTRWLTEVHRLQWTLLCLPLSWGSVRTNQNLDITGSTGNFWSFQWIQPLWKLQQKHFPFLNCWMTSNYYISSSHLLVRAWWEALRYITSLNQTLFNHLDSENNSYCNFTGWKFANFSCSTVLDLYHLRYLHMSHVTHVWSFPSLA